MWIGLFLWLNYDLQALNLRENSGSLNLMAQFPFYREILYKPDFKNKKNWAPVIFDMDMSPGDFISLIYLLKAPIEVIDLKVWLMEERSAPLQ